jgi:opacity protein-like surface antigen
MNKMMIAGAMTAGLMISPAIAADAVRPAPVPIAPVLSAPAGIQGYVGLGGAILNESPCCGSVDAAAFGGALNVPVGGLNVQFDGAGAMLKQGSDAVGYARGAAHVFYRTGSHALGAFAGFEDVFDSSAWFIGGEAQAYLGHVNLYGQAAWQSLGGCCGPDDSSFFVRGSAQLFLTDNILVQGDVKFTTHIEAEPFNATMWGGTVEARLASTPWSVFATAHRSDFSDGDHLTTGLVGVRINVGNMTERQQYTTGASMNELPAE